MTWPPSAEHAPIANGSINVAVIGPDATPPESKAIAVKVCGTKNERISAVAYPGIRNHITEIPVNTRTMESPIAAETATDKLSPIAFADIAPALNSSTCLFKT